MLLRVIDLRSGGEKEKRKKDSDVEIVLHKETVAVDSPEERFTSIYYPSPFSENFRASLAWYFKDYLQEIPALETDLSVPDKDVVAKLIRLGQHMGDNLLGEDHELIKVKEMIEEDGFEQLDVRIESSNPDFFRELWELSVLPESKYLLSSVSKSFVRQFTDPELNQSDGEVRYELSTESPLKVLHLISRPITSSSKDLLDTPRSSDAFNGYVDTYGLEGAIDYEIYPVQGWAELSERLAQDDIHILHYDGPLLLREKKPFLLLNPQQENSSVDSPAERIPLSQLSQTLSSKGKGVLVLDASAYRSDSGPVPADLALAWCARESLKNGFGNVLGLANIADPWTHSLCFGSFYNQLALGLTVGQAIIEARKFLQTQTENNTFTGQAKPFQPWSLLVHYGGQEVAYFNTPQVRHELTESPRYGDHRQNLHGFKSEYLPPQISNGGESNLLTVLKRCRQNHAVYLSGEMGCGKTRLCHQLAVYLLGKPFRYGFYFDFKQFDYSPDNIFEMIAPVLLPDEEGAIEKKLAQVKSLFVFDNLGLATNKPSQALIKFLQTLADQGHLMVLVGEENQFLDYKKILAGLCEIKIKPLSLLEQKIIATPLLRHYQLEETSNDKNYLTMLKGLNGHPFLTVKTIPLLVDNDAELIHKKTARIANHPTKNNIGEEFYQWQWQEMDRLWQSWLLQLVELPDVLLEMISIACDQKKRFQPAADLFKLLGDKNDSKFSDGIRVMDQAGFLLSYPHGKVIDPRVLPFLKAKRDQGSRFVEESKNTKTEAKIETEIKISQVICEGVSLLIPHLQQQPNPALTHNLMMNRGLWVKHMERLWFAEEYRGFIALYNLLGQLMQQHQLSEEMAKWSMDLLSRSDQFGEVDTPKVEKMIAHLNVAVGALRQPEVELPEFIKGAALNWQQWIEKLNSDEVKQQSALFYHCLQFLEPIYRKEKDIENLRHLSEIAYQGYKAHQVWPRALPHLSALAECSFLLNDEAQGLKYERELLEDIPYDRFPAGTQGQIIAQVCASRIIRKNLEGAQCLVDELQALDEAPQLETMIDAMQADIYFQQETFEPAAELYSQLWKQAIEGNPKLNVEHLRDQLMELRTKLGGEKFNTLFEEFAGTELIKPADYRGQTGQNYPESRASIH